MNSIRIGALENTFSLQRARNLHEALAAQEISSEITLVQDEDALLRGDVDILTADMAELPAFLPDSWKIAGVSKRLDPSDSLVVRSAEIMEQGRLFGLPEGVQVACASPLQAGQLRIFRPDLKLVVSTLREGLDVFKNDGYAAFVVPAHYLENLFPDPVSHKVIPLHPHEMIPAPAQGVTGWIANVDDLPVRRLLKRIHIPEVSAVTNVERMALRLIAPATYTAFGAYCSRDKIGNFHVHGILFPADGSAPKRAKLSSSTSFRLAERLVEALS